MWLDLATALVGFSESAFQVKVVACGEIWRIRATWAPDGHMAGLMRVKRCPAVGKDEFCNRQLEEGGGGGC